MIGEKSNRICIVLYSVWHDSCIDPALCRAGDFSDPVISFSRISSVLLLENDLSYNPHLSIKKIRNHKISDFFMSVFNIHILYTSGLGRKIHTYVLFGSAFCFNTYGLYVRSPHFLVIFYESGSRYCRSEHSFRK